MDWSSETETSPPAWARLSSRSRREPSASLFHIGAVHSVSLAHRTGRTVCSVVTRRGAPVSHDARLSSSRVYAMNSALAAAKRLRHRIDEVALVLGPPVHRSLRQPNGTSVLRRTSWDCGCVVDCIDGFPDDRAAVMQWGTCGEHRQIGLLSSNAIHSAALRTPEDRAI